MPRVAIIVPDQTPQPYRFALDRAKVSIGRGKDNDIIIDDPSVSGLHCTMERVSGGYILRDRGSTNSISLDDHDMEIIDLRNGDDVKVGDVVFEYTLSDDELDELDSEDFETHEKKKAEAAAPAPKKKIKPATAKPASAAPYTPPAPVLNSSCAGVCASSNKAPPGRRLTTQLRCTSRRSSGGRWHKMETMTSGIAVVAVSLVPHRR